MPDVEAAPQQQRHEYGLATPQPGEGVGQQRGVEFDVPEPHVGTGAQLPYPVQQAADGPQGAGVPAAVGDGDEYGGGDGDGDSGGYGGRGGGGYGGRRDDGDGGRGDSGCGYGYGYGVGAALRGGRRGRGGAARCGGRRAGRGHGSAHSVELDMTELCRELRGDADEQPRRAVEGQRIRKR
ncbi:hypothetical protein SSP531S_15780 [Streptomyces spongiicola]|uniref:Uncharacterized protein n=1 Tax=Streptomyces spongiicola TaxID=1690221 RepID=A0A388SU76_9ACTN|nr:hypothetical protein SSP531S_15780 [Streptomyces spongiicola]